MATFRSKIKSAKLKPGKENEDEISLELKLDCGLPTGSQLISLIRTWDQAGAMLQTTLEPLQREAFSEGAREVAEEADGVEIDVGEGSGELQKT